MKIHDIVVVGNRSGEWLNRLEISAFSMGMHIISASSLQDGIDIVRQYPEVVDGVVVDVASASSLEHMDRCLTEIGSISPRVAMLIIAGKGVDLQAPQSGKKRNHFVVPGSSEPHEILTELGHMLGSNASADTSFTPSKLPIVRVSELGAGLAGRNYVGECAFRLERCFVARNETEELEAQAVAIRWHYDLLSMLSLPDSDFQLTIRFAHLAKAIKGDKQLSLWLTVHVYALTGTMAKSKTEIIAVQLGEFLTPGASCSAGVYGFRPVCDLNELVESLSPIQPTTILEFQNKSTRLKVEATNGMGAIFDEVRIPSPPRLTHVRSLERVATVLAQQFSPAMFEVILQPTKLTANEIELLRLARHTLWKQDSPLTFQELHAASVDIEDLLASAGQCFITSCRLWYESDNVPESLIATIAREYHLLLSEVIRLPASQGRNGCMEGLREVERLRVIKSLDCAGDVFRLPLPMQQPVCGVPGTHPVFEYTPEHLPVDGPRLGSKATVSGEREIRISPEDLRRHVYALGQTGVGKSTLLLSMIMDRVKCGQGLCLIDPHGDLTSAVYSRLSEVQRSRTMVFDPSNVLNPLGLNMLEYDPSHPEQKTLVVNEMISIFDMLYDLRITGGPIFELYMRNAMLLVMDDPAQQGTLVDVVRVFQESEFRENLVASCNNALVKAFWREADRTRGEVGLENISPYITSKLNQFISNDFVFPIISQRKSTLNFRELIDSKRILLVKLSKGRLGDVGMKLLGMVLFARLLLAALSRDDIKEEDRSDFCLLVDEFQNFSSESVAQMLSEARKYRLNLVLANQTLGQLRSTILESILGNVGNLVFFRPGVNDFERIKPYIDPPFRREEVLNLPNHFAIGRFLLHGVPQQPFVFKTVNPLK